MKPIKKQQKTIKESYLSKSIFWSMIVIFCFNFSVSTFGQTFMGCNYKAGTFKMTLEGHTTGPGFSSRLVLTDKSGVIKYVTTPNSTIFENVIAGNYLAYGITYENAIYIPNLTIGKNIELVSACYKTVVVPTTVCDCNNADGNLVGIPYTPALGSIVNYALTDGKGVILLIKSEPSFAGNPEGVYNIIPVSYLVGFYPQNFVIGKNILSVTGCIIVMSNYQGFVVCSPQMPILSITKKAPTTGFLGVAFDYILVVQNKGGIASNGIITIVDTLAQGLIFKSVLISSTPEWSCQSNIIIVNNSARNTVVCQTSNQIMPNAIQNIGFSVVPQSTGTFMNKASVEGGGTDKIIISNKVETIIKALNQDCKILLCVPIIVTKTKSKK